MVFYYRHKRKSRFTGHNRLCDLAFVLNHEDYVSYIAVEREYRRTILRNLRKNERVVVYLSYRMGWSRRKIRKMTGISERYVIKSLERIRQIMRAEEEQKRFQEMADQSRQELYRSEEY